MIFPIIIMRLLNKEKARECQSRQALQRSFWHLPTQTLQREKPKDFPHSDI
jgi:hypothetical protein